MKNLHKIMFVLGLCIILTGCSDSDSKIKNIDNLEEHGFVYEGEMMCQANDLETKINKKIKLTITTSDGKKKLKEKYSIGEIHKSQYENKITETLDKGVILAVGLCSDRKKIDTWKLEDRANYEKVSKSGQTNIAFFENLDLNLGKYQLYGYYSFDGKKWYINDKIEFEVVDNSILDEETEIGTIKEIYVEAESGKLSVGQNSHIGETNRNGEKCVEAYLGEAGAKLEYRVDTALGGEYELLVRLNDDAVHSDNSRNATIYINETNVKYVHKSEDTKGWKWYSLGSINLEIGENIIIITKDKTTSAAFIIDAFKFVKK